MSKKAKTIKLLLTLEYSKGLDNYDVDDIMLSIEDSCMMDDLLAAHESSGAKLKRLKVERK